VLTNVPPAAREALRPLFAGFPGLHGCVDAVLEGTAGEAFADNLARPAVALLQLDFEMLGGDPGLPAAEQAVRAIAPPASVVVASDSWEPLLRRVWGDLLSPHTRVAFQPGDWDHERLAGLVDALPQGFSLRRIDAASAGRFEELADSLVYNFASLDDFVDRGAGFGIEHKGRFVSGCSSFTISSSSLEFEIQTHPDFRRRGLAAAAASAMIQHCAAAGLEPCWDAHNPISAALATKLGFVAPAPYTAYDVRP
jgi:GNAT superfamily N-acetyltransferase